MLVCLDQRTGTGCGTENQDNAQFCKQCGRALRFALQLHNPGEVIGAYRIVRVIGHGGFGAVYEAQEMATGQTVALKETFDPDQIQSYQAEFVLLARLQHPHLPRYHTVFEAGGNGYLVMELVPGQSLEEVLKKQGGPLLEAQVMGYALQLCDALAYLHRQTPPILHRDMKPANVRLTPEGLIKLVDFGLVKQGGGTTRNSRRAVTPPYAPPEQWGVGGQHTDPRSDLYALGATLFHLLTGLEPPPATDRISMTPDPLLTPHYVNPSLSPAVSDAIVQSMALAAAQRPADAAALRRLLVGGGRTALAGPAPSSSSPTPPVVPPAKPLTSAQSTPVVYQVRSKSKPSWVAGIAILVMLATVMMLLSSYVRNLERVDLPAAPAPTSTLPPTWTPMLLPADTAASALAASQPPQPATSPGIRAPTEQSELGVRPDTSTTTPEVSDTATPALTVTPSEMQSATASTTPVPPATATPLPTASRAQTPRLTATVDATATAIERDLQRRLAATQTALAPTKTATATRTSRPTPPTSPTPRSVATRTHTPLPIETGDATATSVVQISSSKARSLANELQSISGLTFHPILGDVSVRRAIAHCIDREALVRSVYPYLSSAESRTLLMDSFLPNQHWAYGGPYPEMPMYDPSAGRAILDKAGWKQGSGQTRANDAGESLVLKFTTTSALFRQTWAKIMIENLADCGIEVIPTYAPASWWFGDTSGLARRDFELGAFAWVAQSEPGGLTLYTCDQIPHYENKWEGQNYVGWCNKSADSAVRLANTVSHRDKQSSSYHTVQQEFAKDVISIPLFQRVEIDAWRSNLGGIRTDATEYATTNLQEWVLSDGGDTIVIGLTQEPDSMWGLISRLRVQGLIERAGIGTIYTQYGYDFQSGLQVPLSTLENGMASNEIVTVHQGTMIIDAYGFRTRLLPGVEYIDAAGNVAIYVGQQVATLRQLVVKYTLTPFTWSDGTPGSTNDMVLGAKIDCDASSGALSYVRCDGIENPALDITYGKKELSMTVKYLPGYMRSDYRLYPFHIYPSGQVLSDGRLLGNVSAAEWKDLPEIVEHPLSFGPYAIKRWIKTQSIVLEANPFYSGTVNTRNVIFVFVPDASLAVSQLLSGDIDYLDAADLGTGVEAQTVIEAASTTHEVKYAVIASSTWEHVDINILQ